MWQTQWPDWVYKQFDVHELAERVSKKVKMLCKTLFLILLLCAHDYNSIFITHNAVGFR